MWINLWGRDWIVRRRKPTKLGIIGTAIAGVGVIGIAWGNLEDFTPDRIGIALLLLGVTLICYKRLETKNLAADEIFNVGREQGEAEGYEAGYDDGLKDGERNRPVIVPFPIQKCPDCGHTSALQSVGSDRG